MGTIVTVDSDALAELEAEVARLKSALIAAGVNPDLVDAIAEDSGGPS